MPEMTLLGVALLGLMVTWHWMLRPTLLDQTRDKLFDLRAVVRNRFVENEGLDHHVYRDLRNLINGHLRYAESITFVGFLLLSRDAAKHKDVVSHQVKSLEKRFENESDDLRKFIADVRETAWLIMLDYMIKTSPVAWILVVFGVITIVASRFKDVVRQLASSCKPDASFSIPKLAVTIIMAMSTVIGLGNTASARDTLERGAMHS